LGVPDGWLWGGQLGLVGGGGASDWVLNEVRLKLANYVTGVGVPPSGLVLVKLYNVDGSGFPTGSAIATGQIEQSQLVTVDYWGMAYGNGNFENIEMTPAIRLLAGLGYGLTFDATEYAIDGRTIIFFNGILGDGGYPATARTIKYHPDYGWSTGGGVGYGLSTGFNIILDGVEKLPGQADNLPEFPASRPDDYEPDSIWTPSDEPYTQPDWQDPGFSNYQAAGGGRWGQQLVVAGNGRVYYEERE